MPFLELQHSGARLRPLRAGDEERLAFHANDHAVWRNLRNTFPHPYTVEDAAQWIAQEGGRELPCNLAIELHGEPVGCIGAELLLDVHQHTAEVGYWVGKPFWGRGLATAALREFCPYVFETFDRVRLQARVYAWNPASGRVLEKAGFVLECRQEKSVFKDGQLIDSLLYARFR